MLLRGGEKERENLAAKRAAVALFFDEDFCFGRDRKRRPLLCGNLRCYIVRQSVFFEDLRQYHRNPVVALPCLRIRTTTTRSRSSLPRDDCTK